MVRGPVSRQSGRIDSLRAGAGVEPWRGGGRLAGDVPGARCGVPESPLQPEHYCLRSYRNRALNYRRSLWRRLAREWEALSWFEPAPAESAAEREAMRCLTRLPREQREVIVLKIWHDYTFEEVGELLEISPNTAAGRYRYGLQKLRQHLKRSEVEYERDERIGSAITLVGASTPVSEP